MSMLRHTGTAQYQVPDRIDPARTDLVSEFMADPLGRHSDELQLLLAYLRSVTSIPRLAVLPTGRPGRWLVAEIPAGRGEPIRPLPDATVGSLADAERLAFRWRWNALLGRPQEPAS